MFSHKRYHKLWDSNRESDEEYEESSSVRESQSTLPVVNVVHSNERESSLRCLTLGFLYIFTLTIFGIVTASGAIYFNWFIRRVNTDGAKDTVSWSRDFNALTELSAETCDVNGDGILDVLTAGTSSPCLSTLRALDGSNGNTLFETTIAFDVFALNCNADLDQDGRLDCLLAGRFGGFAAIRGQDGALLWFVDSSIVFPRYGFYFPLLVRDLDGDGVRDVINTHGGDTMYAPDNRNRSPGFLVVVSGRTGKMLMDRIPVPDGRETYCSPVLHRLPDGTEMVLFGTGGETIEGSLWAISLESIEKSAQEYAARNKNYQYHPVLEFTNPYCTSSNTSAAESNRPVFNFSLYNMDRTSDISCVQWGQAKNVWTGLQLCVYRILASERKGIVLPVLLVDMNEDKQLDIVVSVFDGHTVVLDGNSLVVVWNKHFTDSESYSVPSPLFFNDDNIPDLLVRVNFGTWNVYQYSDMAILDGTNGAVLWSLRSTGSVMASSVILRAHQHGNDAAMFSTLGDSIKDHSRTSRDESGVCYRDYLDEHSRDCTKSHRGSRIRDASDQSTLPSQHDVFNISALWDGSDFPDPKNDLEGFLHYCNFNREHLSSYLYFIVPNMIFTNQVKPLETFSPYIDVTAYNKRDAQHGSTADSDMQSPQTLRCMHILRPTVLPATPALADLDGDGEIEVIVVTNWSSANGHYQVFRYEVKVFTLQQKVTEVFGNKLVDFSNFLPIHQQPWTKYMGTVGNSVCIN